MQIHKTDLYLEIEHEGTMFQIPKQFGETLYVRLLCDEIVIILIEFPEEQQNQSKYKMNYIIEPDKIHLVSDEDLQNIGEVIIELMTITKEEKDLHEQHNFIIEESDSKSVIS